MRDSLFLQDKCRELVKIFLSQCGTEGPCKIGGEVVDRRLDAEAAVAGEQAVEERVEGPAEGAVSVVEAERDAGLRPASP